MGAKRTFGETVRTLRKKRGESLRVVAANTEIDSTLLSKIERGQRFPTKSQITKLSTYFNIPHDRSTAQVIADKIISEYGHQYTILEAVKIVRERMSSRFDSSPQTRNG